MLSPLPPLTHTHLSNTLDPERSVQLQLLVQELPCPHGEEERRFPRHGLHAAVPAGWEHPGRLAETHDDTVEPEISEDDYDLFWWVGEWLHPFSQLPQRQTERESERNY